MLMEAQEPYLKPTVQHSELCPTAAMQEVLRQPERLQGTAL
jgi:hypothetical protein